MRELKYRQAIFKDGVFHHWHYWGYLPKDGYVGDSYDHFVAPIDIVQRSWDKTYEVKPSQQAIGLCDKTLIKDIYDGDIIRDFKGRILQIAYANHYTRWMASLDGQWCIYYLNDGISGDWKDRNMEFAEVIGNNHETPELLEVKE